MSGHKFLDKQSVRWAIAAEVRTSRININVQEVKSEIEVGGGRGFVAYVLANDTVFKVTGIYGKHQLYEAKYLYTQGS